jgi:threonine aldolase
MNFKSDNITQISQEILDAIISTNHGSSEPYGMDEFSKKMEERFSEIFEKNVKVFLTSTGTAANSLALASIVKSYESILCHKSAHIKTDECHAPNFFIPGLELVLIDGEFGKINKEKLLEKINFLIKNRGPRMNKPKCISLTQGSECGSVYSLNELNEICQIAKKNNLAVHMDGARFANALIHLNCKPSEITLKLGVDVLSFGATKNGALCAEALVFFNHEYAIDFEYRLKQAGQVFSKSRFFAVQFLAYFENDLWLKNALTANSMAKKLEIVFNKFDIQIIYPVEINEVFVELDDDLKDFLFKNNFKFYNWDQENFRNLYRFVTSCFTSDKEIEDFEKKLIDYFEK